jgi:DNA-binding PadR family transcriptional regulator
MEGSNSARKPALAATSWALLGMLSYEQELSGYDIRKWIDWSMRFFYGSPAYSQIYSELKKLEKLGLVTSRVETPAACAVAGFTKLLTTDWTR